MENKKNQDRESIEKEIKHEEEEIEQKKIEIQKDKKDIREEKKEIKELKKEEKALNKEFKIIVNTREKTWDKPEISYQEVIKLAFGGPEDSNIVYDITFSNGPEQNREGTIVKGKAVKVINGMIFNVTHSNKS